MGKTEFRQIRLHCVILDGDLLPRKTFHRGLVVVSGRTQTNTMVTHDRKYFEEKKKQMAGREKQEIYGGVLEDLVEKARHITNTGKTITFSGIYDEEQGQGIFYTEGIGCRGTDGGKWKKRTVRKQKCDGDYLFAFP